MSEEEELPTAAIGEICQNCGVVDLVYGTQELMEAEKIPCEDNQVEEQDLVRRSDVIQLIQNKISKMEYQKKEDCTPREEQQFQDIVNILEELLEEIQQ